MQKIIKHKEIGIVLMFLSILVNWINPFMFHFMVEILVVIAVFCIMTIVISISDISKNGYFLYLGIAFGAVGSLDLVHALAYKELTVISGVSVNMSSQLWLAARYIEVISLLLSFKFINKEVNYKKTFYLYLGIVSLMLLLIFKFQLFPNCFIEGYGITKFKAISDFSIFLALCFVIYLFYINRKNNSIKESNLLIYSIFFMILSRIVLTFDFIDIYQSFMFLEDLFKLLSMCLLYNAIIKSTLKESYNVMFRKLEKRKKELEIMNKELNSKNNELENAQIRIQKSKERYKKLIELWPDAVVMGAGEKIVYVNHNAVKLLKLTCKEDLIGKSIFSIVQDEYKETIKDRIMMQEKEKSAPPLEQKLIRGDGKIIDIEIGVTAVEVDDKEFFLVVLRDLTEIKKLQEMKSKLEETLEMDKLKTEFFSNLSHELRTPINVIYTALQLEDIYIKEKNVSSIEKYNKIVKQNCLRLLRISNNLLDITKIDAGFFKPVIRCCNIITIVEDITASVISYVESKGMRIIFDTEVEEEYVNCDPGLIERIMLNLLSNSIKYGKVNGDILVNIYPVEDGKVAIVVKDNGIGIPIDKQNEIFQRFVRVDKTFARNCEGSGIGLSLVKSLVELQGGTISLISEEGVGSKFTIQFPVIEINEEICATCEESLEFQNAIEKISIEFSDIYL